MKATRYGFFGMVVKVVICSEMLPGNQISLNYRYIERNTNIAILQIRYGYLHRIAFLNLASNYRPEKCGSAIIKRANP